MRGRGAATEHSKPIVGLDLIRVFAAFLVLLFHLAFLGWESLGDPPGKLAIPSLAGISWLGWVGVYIFFVLSGLVIAYSAGTDHYAFFRSRFLRLVPAAWICATFTAVVMLQVGQFGSAETAARYASSVLFSPVGPWIDDVYWTLPIEIAFYAIVWLLLRVGMIHRLPLALTVLGLASCAFWYTSLLVGLPLGYVSWRLMVLSLLPHGCFFAIGGLLWQTLCRQPDWRHWVTIGLCCGAAAVCIGSRDIADGVDGPVMAPILLWLASIALIVVSVRHDRAISGWVNEKLARALGTATYSLYLVHFFVGAAAMHALISRNVPAVIALVLVTAGLVALSLQVVAPMEKALRQVIDELLVSRAIARKRLLGG